MLEYKPKESIKMAVFYDEKVHYEQGKNKLK